MPPRPADSWLSGEEYEPYVGRWSRLVADGFVRWLGVPPGGRWLDVGCGTGALTEAILAVASPQSVNGVDPSDRFVAFARRRVDDPRATFAQGTAEALSGEDETYDAVVSGLVLNFLERPGQALAEFSRVACARLRDRLKETLPVAADGSIQLVARAWAVRGRRP